MKVQIQSSREVEECSGEAASENQLRCKAALYSRISRKLILDISWTSEPFYILPHSY